MENVLKWEDENIKTREEEKKRPTQKEEKNNVNIQNGKILNEKLKKKLAIHKRVRNILLKLGQ